MSRLRGSFAVLLLLATAVAADPVLQLPLPANDLAYDPTTGKIYASVPGSAGGIGNSVTAIDPESGRVGPSVFVGSEPGKLAISDQGGTLYVALQGAAAVRRFDTVPGTPGLQFPLGSDSIFGPFSVEDMAVIPAAPDTVAISRMNPGFSPRHAGVAIYDNGMPRGKVTERHTGSNVIAFAPGASLSPTRLYGYNNETTEFGFRRMTVDASGVRVDDVTENLISGFYLDIAFDGGLVVSTNGTVVDPEARTLLGTFSGLQGRALVAPDVKAGRVYYLVGDGSTRKLLAYDPRTFLQVASWEIAGVTGDAGSLIRWGGDGLAFRTSGGQVFLLHIGQLNDRPPDFSLALDPTTAAGETTLTGTITLTQSARSSGWTLGLSSSDPAAATVPDSAMVAAGAKTTTFLVMTHPVRAATDVIITASAFGLTRTVTLHLSPPVSPPMLLSLSLSPNRSRGEETVTGTVTLSGPAPPGGLTIQLLSVNPPKVTVPPIVTVPAGASSAAFPVMAHGSPDAVEIPITASFSGVKQTAMLEVGPSNPVLSAPVYNPTNGHWYQDAQVPITGIQWKEAREAAEALTYAGYRGHLATITTTDEDEFIFTHVPNVAQPLAQWLGGYQDPSDPGSRDRFGGWHWVTGEPWSYTDWYGEYPLKLSSGDAVLIWFGWDGSWGNAREKIDGCTGFIVEYEPPATSPQPAPAAAQLLLFPNPVPGGLLALGQVVLTQPAGAGGVIVSLTSSNAAAAVVPASVAVTPGASTVTFPIVTFPVAAATPVTITASGLFGSAAGALQVLPASSAVPVSDLAAPTNLTATMAINGRVHLAWTDPPAPRVPGTTETGFAVWRKNGSGDWTRIGDVPANSFTFADANVSPSTLYTYRVQATRDALTSDWSNEASLTTPAGPAAPTGLTAQALAAAQVFLTWSSSSLNATALEVYRRDSGADWRLIAVLSPNTVGYTDRAVQPGMSYSYRVRAANNYFASGWSNVVNSTVPAGL